MYEEYRNRIKSIINSIIRHARKHTPARHAPLFCQFIPVYYKNVAYEDLEARSIADLYAAVYHHWQLLYCRKQGETKLRIYNPHQDKEGWQSPHTLLELSCDDSPFLIDSMRMEINRYGLTTHSLIHLGGIKVTRNKKDEITKILPFNSREKGAFSEAVVYMEIDKQTDQQRLEVLRINLLRVLNDVRLAVDDWQPMLDQLEKTIADIRQLPVDRLDKAEIAETEAFLSWLFENFTFLGYREYKVKGSGQKRALELLPETGLGVLRDKRSGRKCTLSRSYEDLPEGVRRFTFSSKAILLVAKTNTDSTVHRKARTDYIGIKCFNENGDIIGEKQFVGLFTSDLYDNDPSRVPILRRKIAHLLARAKVSPTGYAAKHFLHILKTLPRDDLMHASEDELFTLTMGITHLQERQRVRLFVRKDIYNRYFSCLVYVPRDRFNTRLRERMQAVLAEAFSAVEIEFTPYFSESVLAKVHFIVRVDPKQALKYDEKAIEAKLIEVGRSWQDDLRDKLREHHGDEAGNELYDKYQRAFPSAYRETFSVNLAVSDIGHIESLHSETDLAMSFYRPLYAADSQICFKLFRKKSMIPLSDAVPMFENMGLRVIGEHPYEILSKQGERIWINNFNMRYCHGEIGPIEKIGPRFQKAFRKLWYGKVENDSFNRLVLGAGLTWRQVTILRAYAKYLRQTTFTFSQPYIESVLNENTAVVRLLIDIFEWRFDPDKQNTKTQSKITALKKKFRTALNCVTNLDQDRILSRYLDVIEATIRTNYFRLCEGENKPYIAFKFDPSKIPELPLPLPKYECFVYSPRFEGVHLRYGKVARGGIRWSDRLEDFRTEVLGLVKAQHVKNSVIVPVGAKGGFILKGLSPEADRKMVMAYATDCYKNFMRALLDVTDNLVNGKVRKPKQVVCYDEDDPYLVVAADKGTATFSDLANAIAAEYGFWLGDAFASGGSAGYDHKKMGITARGAWESVKRQFFELGIDISRTDFTVVGIGDMSGDVFGNGMLLSKHIKLVAAFNHMHIFLDPTPNTRVSFKERARLFKLPRSTWDDYDKKLISKGGGVYSRTLKSIKLSVPVKKMLAVKKDTMTPNELIRALLKMQVDLLWNGGIGTYVKAGEESHQAVFDWSNDAVRVNGSQLHSRIVVEGGNLGLTQLGRIEYEFSGGKVNADFIDNAGGVDCSDHEVNAKILLNDVIHKGNMTLKRRNQLLVSMTDDVAALVLANNYRQNIAISLSLRQQLTHFNFYQRYLEYQQASGFINLELEFLPDMKLLADRRATHSGKGLTRPEIAILLAYSKLELHNAVLASDLPEDDFFAKYVELAFPHVLRKRYRKIMNGHHLYREIVATQISNSVVNDMGIIFIHQMQNEIGASIPDIIKAYVIAREIFEMDAIWQDIAALECKIDVAVQLEMFEELIRLVRRGARWILRNNYNELNVKLTVKQFLPRVRQLFRALRKLMKGDERAYFENKLQSLLKAGVPEKLAVHTASIRALYPGLNIAVISLETKVKLEQVADVYFALSDTLGLGWLRDQVDAYPIDSHWSVLARSHFKANLDRHLRVLATAILKTRAPSKQPIERYTVWFEKNTVAVKAWQKVLADMRACGSLEFTMLSVAVLKLQELSLGS